MRKLTLVMASLAGIGIAVPGYAMDSKSDRIQLAQAGLSVSIGERPVARERVIVRGDRDRHHRNNWRSHRAQSDVVIVKKRKPARRTVIIER